MSGFGSYGGSPGTLSSSMLASNQSGAAGEQENYLYKLFIGIEESDNLK